MVFRVLFFLFPFFLCAEIGYIEPWEGEVKCENTCVEKTTNRNLSPLGIFAEKMILLHRNYITHISGPRSNFRPTSSQYMLEAIRAFGFTKGYLMGCDRLLRENSDPWVYRSKKVNHKLYKWDPVRD